MNRLRAVILLVGIVASIHAFAQEPKMIADLRAHRFDAIERTLQATERDFLEGRVGEQDLVEAYGVFYMRDDVLSGDLQAWVQAHPGSHVAHQAFGTYRRKLGELHRGDAFANRVPDEDMDYAARQFELAKPELRRALALNPRSYLAMLYLMNIARYQDDRAMADEMLVLSNRVYPANLLIRARYFDHLAPRWGGSMAKMDAFLARSRASGTPAQAIQLLEAMRCNEQGFLDEQGGLRDRALLDYRRSLVVARGLDPRVLQVYLGNALQRCSIDSGQVTCQ